MTELAVRVGAVSIETVRAGAVAVLGRTITVLAVALTGAVGDRAVFAGVGLTMRVAWVVVTDLDVCAEAPLAVDAMVVRLRVVEPA